MGLEMMEARKKEETLKLVRDILPEGVTAAYVRQPRPLGLGHAVLCAKRLVGNEPFAVILADDLIDDGGAGCLSQMVEIAENRGCSVLGVECVEADETDKYGIVSTTSDAEKTSRVEAIVEKPHPSEAPSRLAVVGRYILTPAIFRKLEHTERGAGGEIQLTDAISSLLADEVVLAYEFTGERYDCGSKLGYLQATVEYALKHEELKEGFEQYLRRFKA